MLHYFTVFLREMVSLIVIPILIYYRPYVNIIAFHSSPPPKKLLQELKRLLFGK
jgi:hypothetical protein